MHAWMLAAPGRGRRILGDDEIAVYERDGLLVPRYRLPPADLAKLQRMCERLVADNPHAVNVPFTNMHVPSYAVQKLNCGPRSDNPFTNEWLQMAAHPDILDLLEQLIGPDIVMWATALFHKEARTGGKTHYHRDAIYYPIRPLVAPNVWIAVTESTLANSCVCHIPGSHKARVSGKHGFSDGSEGELVNNKIDDSEFDVNDAVPVELEPGQMYVSDVFSLHGGGPNTSDRPRTGYSIRYFPSARGYEHAIAPGHAATSNYNDFKSRPLFLMRGVDRSGRNDFSIGHPVRDGGLALVRSPR